MLADDEVDAVERLDARVVLDEPAHLERVHRGRSLHVGLLDQVGGHLVTWFRRRCGRTAAATAATTIRPCTPPCQYGLTPTWTRPLVSTVTSRTPDGGVQDAAAATGEQGAADHGRGDGGEVVALAGLDEAGAELAGHHDAGEPVERAGQGERGDLVRRHLHAREREHLLGATDREGVAAEPRVALDRPADEDARRGDPGQVREAEEPVHGPALEHGVGDVRLHAGEHEGRDAEPDGRDAQRRHERRHLQQHQGQAAEAAEGGGQQDRDQDPDDPEVVVVAVVGDQEGDRERGRPHDPGDGQVDGTHQEHERDAAGHDGEDRRRVHDVLHVADGPEVRAQDREDPEHDHQGHRWAGVPERHPPPRPRARRDDVQVLGGGCHRHEIGP